MTHLLTDREAFDTVAGHFMDAIDSRGPIELPGLLLVRAQLAKTIAEIEAFPGDSRYVAVPREWITEVKKELGE